MRFPLPFIPKYSYHTGGRFFGAPRPKGRRHAACDLIAPLGTEVYAIDAGVVAIQATEFYRGTSAMAIRHQGRSRRAVLRDFEPRPRRPIAARRGRAKQIAHVGKMFVDSMLLLHP